MQHTNSYDSTPSRGRTQRQWNRKWPFLWRHRNLNLKVGSLARLTTTRSSQSCTLLLLGGRLGGCSRSDLSSLLVKSLGFGSKNRGILAPRMSNPSLRKIGRAGLLIATLVLRWTSTRQK
jgi:hypothetical protein